MKFVEELKEYANNRSSKIVEKQQYIKGLQVQLQSKKDEVKKLENDYKQTFDDKVFDNLLQSKKDADNVQDDINKISGIISLMDEGNFQYDAATLESEIDEYINGLELEKLKDAISKAKDAYIASLDAFITALNDIGKIKNEIMPLRKYTDKQTRQHVINCISKHKEEFYLNDAQISQYIKTIAYEQSMTYEDAMRAIARRASETYGTAFNAFLED